MELYRRENYLKKIRAFYHADDIIKVITGVRRCGKSSLMKTVADELRENGIKNENILYIDLDLRGYRNIKNADQLETLIYRWERRQVRNICLLMKFKTFLVLKKC